jgi:secreted PhoX family phosphatase
MDSSVSRRTLLTGAAAGFGFAFAGSMEAFARPAPRIPGGITGYGPLIPAPGGVLSLPAGFSYVEVARSGVTDTDDGVKYPSDPDGMGVFAGAAGGSVLITNHEISANEPTPVPGIAGLTYDPGAIGGTSTVTVDEIGNLCSTYTSLAGTDNNCAGGVTPWGTWLTCEETERRAETVIGGRTLEKDHGYVFEVDPVSRAANVDCSPVPLSFLGRYSHEAVAVDPDTHRIYLTEDAVNPNGLYYRWTPPRGFRAKKGALRALAEAKGADAGRLQAMSCRDGRRHIVDLSEATEIGTRYRVQWVDVRDRLALGPPPVTVRQQDFDEPITRSRKLEGSWWGNGGAYFVASFARPEAAGDGSLNAHDGQVWFYDPERRTVTLKTLFGLNREPDAQGTFDGPDNITVSPHGGLIVAEDGEGFNHLVGVSRRGRAYPLARNDHEDNGEFCGPTFSLDGKVLFANIQSPNFGATLAITGPWRGRS